MDSLPVTQHPSERPRRTKFTDANLRQIVNLVERGISPAEIAETIGVTVGTLKTTCSKLQISLRRPSFDTDTGLLRRRRTARASPAPSQVIPHRVAPIGATLTLVEIAPKDQEPASNGQQNSHPDSLATVTIVMEYKGQTHTAKLPLTVELIARLAIEAEFRGTNLVQLIARSLESMAMEDHFALVLGEVKKSELAKANCD